MTDYPQAKREFLTWINQQAAERGINLTIDPESRLYYREPEIIARVRATTKETQFQTQNAADELTPPRDLKREFDRLVSVILQVNEGSVFDPETDHFYPVRVNLLQDSIGSKHASGEYQLNFKLNSKTAGRYRDDLNAALGLPRDSAETIGPSGTNQFQDIVRDFGQDADDSNE